MIQAEPVKSTTSPADAVAASTAKISLQDKNHPRNLDHLYQLIIHYAKSMGRRPADFFKDFDPLRSGLMSIAQFERGLSGLLDKGPVFSVTEIASIRNAYQLTGSKAGRVEYSKFLEKLDEINNIMSSKTKDKKNGSVSGPFKHVRLAPEEMEKLHSLFFKLSSWVRYHGASLKSWFKDFDRHHNGLVTQDQFHRSLPTHLLSEEETALLFKAYHDKTTNMFHYVRLNTSLSQFSNDNKHHHIDKSVKGASKYNHSILSKQVQVHHVPIGTENLLLADEEYVEEDNVKIEHLEEKVKKIVYKRRVKLSDFCRDFDRLNRGLISLTQFESAMHMSGLDFSQKEVEAICLKYGIKTIDSWEIHYRQFCQEIDSIFTIPNLEQHPTSNPTHPARDFLNQTTHNLNAEEEAQFITIIKNLRRQIEVRSLSVSGYFLDFDKGQGNTGRITKSHLSRILSMIPLKVSEDDLFILFRKYEDHCGDVIYHDFVKLLESPDPFGEVRANNGDDSVENGDDEASNNKNVSIDAVLRQIEHFVRKNSIRVQEFFRDVDQLRLGSIRHEEFIKGISRMGFPLSEDEGVALCQAYQDPKRPECSLWKQFAVSIEKGQPSQLEQNPDWRPPAKTEISRVVVNSFQEVIAKCQKVLRKKPVLLKPFFRDFDKTGSGHVTFVQAKQCFTYGRLELSEGEAEGLLERYGNKEMLTFDYLTFLKDIESPIVIESPKKHTILTEEQPRIEPKNTASASGTALNAKDGNINQLLFRLKSLIKTERFRYFEHFMRDLDPLKHGTLSVSDFSRSLLAFPLPLSASDVSLLAQTYASATNPSRVNYRSFCQEMESVFTLPEWEKFPTRGDVNFVPSLRDEPYVLNRKEQEICEKAMNRLATQLYQRRMDIYNSFEDYDKLHNGTIPSSHFKSVLTNHNLLLYFDQGEDCVMKRFRIHQKPDSWIDYGKFCEVLGAIVEKMENGESDE